jgi:hypothetical protein
VELILIYSSGGALISTKNIKQVKIDVVIISIVAIKTGSIIDAK